MFPVVIIIFFCFPLKGFKGFNAFKVLTNSLRVDFVPQIGTLPLPFVEPVPKDRH